MDIIRSYLENRRAVYIGQRVCSTFKVTPDKWEMLIKDDDSRGHIQRFLGDNRFDNLIFFINSKGFLVCSPDSFAKGKKGFTCFKRKRIINNDDDQEFINALEFVDVPKNPIDFMYRVTDNVYSPLSKATKNVQKFSKPVASEIVSTMSEISGSFYILSGKAQGMTVLTAPPKELLSDPTNPASIHKFEQLIIQWVEQTNSLIREELPENDALTPMDESKFWNKRLSNFELIDKQLKDESVQEIVKVLEEHSKPFADQFTTIVKNVDQALELATETSRALRPVDSFVQKLDTTGSDLESLHEYFEPTFHLLFLMYSKTKWYHSPRHLCSYLRKITDFFARQFASAIDGSGLLSGDPAETINHINESIVQLERFVDTYSKFKTKLLEAEGSTFTLNNQAVMHNFLELLRRMEMIKPLIQTIIEFNRFDKTEVGGIHGNILSTKFSDLVKSFQDVESKFTGLDCNLLEISDSEFEKVLSEIETDFNDLDVRAVAIAIWAITDVSSTVSLGQILSGFNALLRRPFFISSFKSQYQTIIELFNKDVEDIGTTYRLERQNPPILHGIPPTTSDFIWCNGLLSRLNVLVDTLQSSIPEIFEDPGMIQAVSKKEELAENLKNTMTEKISKWASSITENYKDKLKKPLILRDPKTRLLSMNFDPELKNLLEEVRFLSSHMTNEIPAVAREIYQNNAVYMEYMHSLQVLIERYNHPVSSIVDVERPMFQKHIDHVDQILEQGISTLTWENTESKDFLSQAVTEVSKFSELHNMSTSNIKDIKNKILEWKTPALFARPDAKKSLDQAEVYTTLQNRSATISKEAEEIIGHVRDSVKLLTDDPSSPETKQYLDYVQSLIVDGFKENILFSLETLNNDLEGKVIITNSVPLITTRLELIGSAVNFSPPLLEGPQNLLETFKDWCNKALDLSKLISPFYDGQESTYEKIAHDEEITSLVEKILGSVEGMSKECIKYRDDNFSKYSNVWTQSRESFITDFLKNGGTKEVKDGKQISHPPNLQQFSEQIGFYRTSQSDIRLIQDTHSFGWLRVDCRPLKQSLDLNLGKWVYLFTHFLNNRMLTQLKDFQQFLHDANAGLDVQVKKGDVDQLIAVLEAMLLIRNRVSVYDALFDELKETVNVLKQHGVTVTDALLQKIDEGPKLWLELKNKWGSVQEKTAPLQQEETARLRQIEDKFVDHLAELREDFLKEKFFSWEIGYVNASNLMDKWDQEMEVQTDEFEEIKANGELLEFTTNPCKNLTALKDDLRVLRKAWDIAHDISTEIAKWKNTLWSEVDFSLLSNECDGYSRTMRHQIDKRAKEWGVYTGLETLIKSVSSAIPILEQLHNDKLRERHWSKLKQITGVDFQKSVNLKLGDILDKNLMRFGEDITEICDGANNEVRMETALSELKKTWSSMEFAYKPMEGFPELLVLNVPEELVQTLEENQVAVQNHLSSKNISFFRLTLNEWQQKLKTVEQVITVWTDVQYHWTHLRPIFIGSEDIRKQLPKQSESFENIDKQMIDFINKQQANLNVVDTCNQPDILKFMEMLIRELTIIEKSLNEYLETKRHAFPRFYFVSSNDLLDILSKGRHPKDIEQHFSKVFDNLVKVEWVNDNTVSAMISKEGEKVDFLEDVVLSGPVEVWLQKLLDSARATLKEKLADAASAVYDKDSRPQWLVDRVAQIGLTSINIQWNKEVNAAFKQLEEGMETAMKDYNNKQNAQLGDLINMIRGGSLSKLNRQKITVVCQNDAHNRDVVKRLVAGHEETHECFEWQSQLRFSWRSSEHDCFINIIDAEFTYQYEYLGSPSRLVVTPLTDRCYITLTQSLSRIMGGAPAGPAGTGKTETVKDLARAMGQVCFVFNCSEQMDHESLALTFKGLSQAGAWGCFDEFNRIAAKVLSVVAIQVKSILDALRANVEEFKFGNEMIGLKRNVGIFITMNPGYAGRTELPENIKALFRSCSMCVPDFQIICEIMLMSVGFKTASDLTKKFTTLYSRCQQLLSKQLHYDWGLRAVKSVLVVAGSLRSADPDMSEDAVLMRALRDFNIPKIVTNDLPVFLGLINDLFPKIDVPRKRNKQWEEIIRSDVLAHGLQGEDQFVRKVVEFDELLEVRHSVFIIGAAGTGKTEIWRALSRANGKRKTPCTFVDLNPKAVTNNELFGFLNPATRDWQDGLFSTIMRNLSKLTTTNPKWIILDGDIDPCWIESLNTVMDDNKVLTLASNERIPLTTGMRLVFEISHLKCATPATVSRAGILFVNETDVGPMAYAYSWIDRRTNPNEKSQLTVLFNNYVTRTLEMIHQQISHIVPITDVAMVETLCRLLEGLLTEQNIGANAEASLYELYFVFAAVWAFGGACDDMGDNRQKFNAMWRSEWRTVVFPQQGTVFDYYVDPVKKKLSPWSEITPQFEYDIKCPVSNSLVFVPETMRTHWISKLLIQGDHPVMLAGFAGTGKSVLVRKLLNELDENEYMFRAINFNYYTTSAALQTFLESAIEMKSGKLYSPPGTKKCVYFIDDLNMPMIDTYFTQEPMTLLRQHMDYEHWYDRTALTLKDVKNVNYISCMNPTSGSFTIDPRLQRHFSTLAMSIPQDSSVKLILSSMLNGHMQALSFNKQIPGVVPKMIDAIISTSKEITKNFLPTAIKFHYNFNLREISNVLQGILRAHPSSIKTPKEFSRLFGIEAIRVYCDRMVDLNDYHKAKDCCITQATKSLDALDPQELREELTFTAFAPDGDESNFEENGYAPVVSMDQTVKVINDKLNEYNETHPVMNLVLFKDAIEHVIRISRGITNPNGHMLLVGLGGSGKQSLVRLASYLVGYNVFQITLSNNYGVAEFNADLVKVFILSGGKKQPTVFLLTDAQVIDEKFLIPISDFLSTGVLPDVFQPDDFEQIFSLIKGDMKIAGIQFSPQDAMKFFTMRVRQYLRIVFCQSPSGDTFRVRARRFPALINCMNIDWFHAWPEDALLSVAQRFLSDVDLDGNNTETVVNFIAQAHTSVIKISEEFLASERRHNYATPKSFLELISAFKTMLEKARTNITESSSFFSKGVQMLNDSSTEVERMKAQLEIKTKEVAAKRQECIALIDDMKVREAKVTQQSEAAKADAAKVAIKRQEAQATQDAAEADLKKAIPLKQSAEELIKNIDKDAMRELASFSSPPGKVADFMPAVILVLSEGGRPARDLSWKAAKKLMGNTGQFITKLTTLSQNMDNDIMQLTKAKVAKFTFGESEVRNASVAAAALYQWLEKMLKYHDITLEIAPKIRAANDAKEMLQVEQAKLDKVEAKVRALEADLAALKKTLDEKNAEAAEAQAQAAEMDAKIKRAIDLVAGLGGEGERWKAKIAAFNEEITSVVGDSLLAAAFVSYAGPFTRAFRERLVHDIWKPFLVQGGIKVTKDPLGLLSDDGLIAAWSNQGLPNDTISIENAAITTAAQRWPLFIDPQFQGIKWITSNQSDHDLKVLRFGQDNFINTLTQAVENGTSILIENVDETFDPIINPILGRNIIKKGRRQLIQVGDREVEFNPNFKLFLQTKLANPHFQPEIQAQTTVINFTVTLDGLEEQLLGNVVNHEKEGLEERKAKLIRQMNEDKIKEAELEKALLNRLRASTSLIDDTALMDTLETTKKTSAELNERLATATVTTQEINTHREAYRRVASRAALLYFILVDLAKIDHMYQFSLASFITVFIKAMDEAEKSNNPVFRENSLIDSITYKTFKYTMRGLFQRHQIIFTALLCFRILLADKQVQAIKPDEFVALLRCPRSTEFANPGPDWLSDSSWSALCGLKSLEAFKTIPQDVTMRTKPWQKWCDLETPEVEKLPLDYKNKSEFQKLLVIRALRPDRMVNALTSFIANQIGEKYTFDVTFTTQETFSETDNRMGVFYILSPGSDPIKDVEALGNKLGFSAEKGNFYNISLGEGQEENALNSLTSAAKDGGWVVIQNLHLMGNWLMLLEKHIEKIRQGEINPTMRIIYTAEPSNDIPAGILQNAIKVTNEPARGTKANLMRALNLFNDDSIEQCQKDREFKALLFHLCVFHAIMVERRKFGPQGFNRVYNFSPADLQICQELLFDNLDTSQPIPWVPLRYLIGEIMYGGHISDDRDRRLCATYLESFDKEDFEGGELVPGFPAPTNCSTIAEYKEYAQREFPEESPYLFGLHPNAEIGSLTTQTEFIFTTLLGVQPRSSGAEEGGKSMEETVKKTLDEIMPNIPDPFNMAELYGRVEKHEPYVSICLQECERMNILMAEIKRSLAELNQGLEGELTISEAMDALMMSMYVNKVPASWEKLAYFSLRPLMPWFKNLLDRHKQLQDWSAELTLPNSVWLPGLFNPSSFLTAVAQSAARKNAWALDKTILTVEVTKKQENEIEMPPRDGAYIHGLYLEGARWDSKMNSLNEAYLKELYPQLPVMYIRAVLNDKPQNAGRNAAFYECPVYVTKDRGPTYVSFFNLKINPNIGTPSHWVKRGVAILLEA